MIKKLLAMLPASVEDSLRNARDFVKATPYHGSGRFCPVCGKSSSRFRAFGLVPRADAQCTHCGALERHRLLWFYLTNQTDLFDGWAKKMLHVAPERCFESRLRKRLGKNYLTADLLNPRAMIKMDITDIQYPDGTFDVIYCSHVLEHVPDDHRAMQEFHRVLKPDGWAILLVPIMAEKTFEDASIVEPAARLKAFGQEDHVRKYGPDYVERLRAVGFKVKVTHIGDLIGKEDAIRMGLTAPGLEGIYFCTK